MKQTTLALLMSALLHAAVAHAQEPNDAQLRFFEAKIRPALMTYCYECHSVEAGDSRAGLLVDSRQGLLEGGDSGPAIVAGEPEESLLWHAINWDGYEMPPSQQMPESVIADFEQWIKMGAPDPREREIHQVNSKISAADIEAAKSHWAFQPPSRNRNASIDSIVNARLREEGLRAAPPADAMTLLRRMQFNIIGLPPTPEEISAFQIAFERDPDSAIASKVDELLSRTQFGERWGRHWMDVARYAESSGSRNFSYPHAWRYRNYVIDSFNEDTPYDRFIAEQIAGDLLPVDSDEQWQKNLIATGFLAIGMKHLDQKNPRIFMADMVDEQIDTMTQAVLGLTVACARCHDHKYDPIPTRDYYAMAGIMRSTNTLYGTQRVAQNHRAGDLLLLPIEDDVSLDRGLRGQSVETLQERLADVRAQIREMGGRRSNREDGEAFDRVRALQRNAQRIEGELATLNSDGSKKTFGMGVQEADRMVNANILLGGEVDQPAQEVPRGFLQVFGELNFQVEGNESSGRWELVQSMTSESNPLTARVMANRVWMHLLGRPIVGTPNNFGFSGLAPENQELIDYLAVRFMEEGWSVKALIREIVLSDTYQRSSKYDAENYAVDPDNKWLWRVSPRQLDAEAMRDAMLLLAGRLDYERPYGSAIAVGGDGKPGGVNIDANDTHRSVYLPIVRDELIEPLALFDFPDANITSAGRSESIVPTQALYVMNGEFVAIQAQSMAAELERRFENSSDQVRTAFLWAYSRPATENELRASEQFFLEFRPLLTQADSPQESQAQRGRNRGRGGQQANGQTARGNRRGGRNAPQNRSVASPPNQALVVFCQSLMASARFRILN